MALLGKQSLGLICSRNTKHMYISRSDVQGKSLHSFNVSLVQKLISSRLLSYNIQSVCHSHYVTYCKNCLYQKDGLPETQHSHFLKRVFSTKCNLIANIMRDLNVDELRAKSDRKKGIQTVTLVKETLAKKCDEAIANLNDEDVKKLKVIQLEHGFLFSEGHFIPSPEEMKSENWLEALTLPSAAQRLKYYNFVMKRMKLKKKEKLKPTYTKEEPDIRKPHYEHGQLFMRFYETTMRRWLHYGLVNAMQFGLPLVIDMDYVSYMRAQEIQNTVKQLLMVYNVNRTDSQLPYHLHFTSCPEDHIMYKMLQVALQDNEHFLATVTEKSYLDIFDPSQLVYLSPNAEQVMKEFDPDAVYIIGAFNDKESHEPVSQARAKKQGIRSLRLPIDEHVQWNLGSKCITLDQVLKLMTSAKNGVPWKEAILNSVPKRKIRN